MFVAPGLYLIHAILTGVSLFIAASMHWIAGFGFSAGLIDMLLSTRNPLAVQWYMLIIQGVVFYFLYYFIFTFFIKKYNLKTPGREEDDLLLAEEEQLAKATTNDDLAYQILPLLGGIENLLEIDNCITRLRLNVKDSSLIDEKAIKKLGIPGVLKTGKSSVQVIIGTQVEFVANALKKLANK